MSELTNNTQQFTPEEIQFLRSKGLISYIAEKVVSTRSQGRNHVSREFVGLVINGKVSSESDTVTAIRNHAKELLQTLNK